MCAIEEDKYLHYRISERFNKVMKSLFDHHKTDKLPPEQSDILADMKEHVQTYLDMRKDETPDKAKAIVLCKPLGLNASKLTDVEWRVLMKVLDSSAPVRSVKRWEVGFAP